MGTTEHAPEAASPGAPDGRPHAGPPRLLLACLVLVALSVAVLLPISGTQLEGHPSFVPAMLALVGCLDLLSAVVLVRQFHDTGDRPSLALAWAYLSSLVVLAGYGA